MIIVDTSAWVDYLGRYSTPQTRWLDMEAANQRLGLTDLILCEVLQGIRDDSTYDLTRTALLEYIIFEASGIELMLDSAQNYRFLRAQGITIRKTVDCIIATFCIKNQLTLLHNDHDFDPFEQYLGLQVIHPEL